jgi:uroporphyrinogen-III decarboxylase
MGHAEYASGGIDYDNKINELYKTPYDALNFDPWELYGQKKQTKLIEDFNKHYNKQCETVTDTVNMTGIYVSCMSGLLEIFGWDILLAASGLEPNKFGELANRYSEWVFQYFEALAYSEAPIVMIHDDIVWSSGAFIHPDWYRKYIFPNYKKCFKPLIENGKIIIFTSDGNYDEFVDDIAKCQINGFVLEPLTDMKNIAEKYGKTHFFAGNADTRILLSGTKEEIYDEVKRCMDIGKKHPGFFMAVGNHIPSNTPVENALYYNDAYEKLCRR